LNLELKLVAALLGLSFFAFVALSIRSSSIRPSFAWLWLGIGAFLVSVPLLEPLYRWLAHRVVGVHDARTIVYVPLIGFLLIYSFRLTQVISRMSDRVQELITHTAVLEARIGELQRERGGDDPPQRAV
jgi:hypothetical protein